MFTGIVEAAAKVLAVEPTDAGRRVVIDNPFDAPLELGASVAVNGVCLTVVASDAGLAFDAVHETLDRSSLGSIVPGSLVNLERPMPANGRFDGHVVQGHVDGVGKVARLTDEGDARRIAVELSSPLMRYVVEKGSITVDGVSLTVTGIGDGEFEFVVIPHTAEATTLGAVAVGDLVNIEVDVIAKYVERLLEAHA